MERAPARSLSEDRDLFPPALLNRFSSQLSMLWSMVFSIMIWYVYLCWRASLIQRERKDLFVGSSCEPEKIPSPSFSEDPSLLQQVKSLICCSSSRNLCFDRCFVAMSASIC